MSDEPKTGAPKWYSAEELWRVLRLDYAPEIADRISVDYAANLQRAFIKGYEIGLRADRRMAEDGEDRREPSMEEREQILARRPWPSAPQVVEKRAPNIED